MTMRVEKYTSATPETVENLYGAPKKQWKKWTAEGKRLFNELYGTMSENDRIFSHPEQECNWIHWRTVCWNAAWHAASFVSRKDTY